MKIKDLIYILSQYPEDYDVEVCVEVVPITEYEFEYVYGSPSTEENYYDKVLRLV